MKRLAQKVKLMTAIFLIVILIGLFFQLKKEYDEVGHHQFFGELNH